MYKLIKHSENYSKIIEHLWQYYRAEANSPTTCFESFKCETKITRNTPADGNTKDVEIAAPLKYLSNFCRTLEMLLRDVGINLVLTWSVNCVITNSIGPVTFEITDTNIYVTIVALSTQDNPNLLKQ